MNENKEDALIYALSFRMDRSGYDGQHNNKESVFLVPDIGLQQGIPTKEVLFTHTVQSAK